MVFKNNFDLNNETQEDLSDCNAIKISIASPEKIRSWSHGEVKESETINYRTGKPEKHGLFCPEIFGPTKDYECFCGKYKQIKYKGVVCEKCHVEVTTSDVRRKRFGHIELVTPVAHIWFIPKIETLLGCGQGKIKDVIYYEKYIVTDAKLTDLEDGQILSETQVEEAKEKYGSEAFEIGIGAESIQKLLAKIDLEKEKKKLIARIKDGKLSKSEKIKNIKKLNLIEDFLRSGNKLEWMILSALPVIPPDLRPIVQLESGQWSTGDLNELYRRILNRNNRLKVLIELDAPDLLVKTGKKLLQQMVDALFDNEKIDNPVKTMNKRQFKSLSDSLKVKSGRFRQNLLGKRVDYSGRTVIVVGAELKINQCGLPKKMALELFRPFVYAKLEQYGYSDSIKESKKMVDEEELIVWNILEEVIKDHPVLLNRPPTLHRLSIQAFDPILVDGNAIQVHPLVCAAFNADFDGDAMAVHIPLSIEAQIEAKVLMMSTNNILHPKDGKPMITPTCDMMFGIYYITMDSARFKEKPIIISSYNELEQALFKKMITLNDYIIYRFKVLDEDGNWVNKTEKTTAGRVKIFNSLPENARTLQVIPMFNKTILKADIKALLDYVYRATSQYDTCLFGDAIMQIGFKESCKSGISVGKDDILVPKNKEKQITDTKAKVNDIQQNYRDGLITENERYNKIVTSWSDCSDELSKEMLKQMESTKEPSDANSLYMLMKSGARGNKSQIQQMCSMRGLMTDASGGIIEVPIVSNLKEGLSGYEYFISTNLARKGFATVALLTAKGGYFTRKLLGIAQDIVVIADDCGSEDGIILQEKINSKGQIVTLLPDRALGRTLSKDVLDLVSNKVLLKNGTLIGEEEAKVLAKANIKKIEVRSALTCKCKDGICAKCYGRDLSSGNLVTIGDAVGVIAAQAIGEPGTQLTLNTKHNVGGSTSSIDFVTTPYDGSLRFKNYNEVVDKNGNVYVISRNFIVEVLDENKYVLTSFNIPYGAKIFVKDGSSIKQGEKLAEWDKLSLPIIATYSGKVDFGTLKLKKRYDSENDSTIFIVTDKNPSLTIGDQLFELQNGAILNIQDKEDVQVGDVIAKIQKGILTKGDITGGLNEVEHLFELTKRIFVEAKSELALISEVSGIVNIKKSNTNGKKKIQILDKSDKKTVLEEYDTYSNINILVEDGDEIKRGDYLLGGEENPNDILRINGISAFVKYMTENVQKIYESQGISISDKHIELILSRMITNVEIVDNGDSELNIGDVIDKYDFDEENKKVVERGLIPMQAKGVALGLTETSVKKSKSFIAAMSLQNTQEILVKSSIKGQTDDLRGLKENMIIGRLMPAGTGLLVNKIKKNI